MTTEERERMNSVCLRIQEEKDYLHFEVLVRELDEVIGRKQRRFSERDGIPEKHRRSRPWKMISCSVQKIVQGFQQNNFEIVEITISEAEDLFREIRIENTFNDVDGEPVALKQGARVDVTLEADPKDTIKKAAYHHKQ